MGLGQWLQIEPSNGLKVGRLNLKEIVGLGHLGGAWILYIVAIVSRCEQEGTTARTSSRGITESVEMARRLGLDEQHGIG